MKASTTVLICLGINLYGTVACFVVKDFTVYDAIVASCFSFVAGMSFVAWLVMRNKLEIPRGL